MLLNALIFVITTEEKKKAFVYDIKMWCFYRSAQGLEQPLNYLMVNILKQQILNMESLGINDRILRSK
jgi:hypothetical protein